VEIVANNEESIVIPTSTENKAELANPASSYCLENGGQLEIVSNADGNGTIMCSMLTDYPDFSTYLIASCIDDSSGKLILR